MAGHSKWSKVKHIKARVDAIKGRVFSKCAHEIALAARAGGSDPAENSRLRTAIDNAKSVSMPKDNIDRAIKKGSGELGVEATQEISYEGYGPAGTAFIIEMATDNLNHVSADLRLIFSKNGVSGATQGSVSYQFDRKGEISIPAANISENDVTLSALEAGADDILSDSNEHVILTAANELGSTANALRTSGLNIISKKLVSIPQTSCVVSDLSTARQVFKLDDLLDDYADTLNFITNFDIADPILDQLAS